MLGVETENKLEAVGVVERLLATASEHGASDLHLDPDQEGMQVSMRKDGVLERLEVLPSSLAPRIVGRIKALAELLVYRTDLPQEGRIAKERSGIDAELRVATYPGFFGECVALRLDSTNGLDREVATLGLAADTLKSLQHAIRQPDGLVLMTGPSGSGKSTTLYACLQELASADGMRKIVTVEDPVETCIRGVTQTEINPHAGLGFSEALRSLLRQDPDVILIGEIRDRETASIALEAGLTGHLVLATVHAGTAPLVFARLLEMGVEPFVLTSVVRGVLAQRLLRRSCSDDSVSQSEYSGRCLVSEWLPMSAVLRQAILDRGDAEELERAALSSGYRSLRDEARALVEKGLSSEEEVERVLGNL